MLPRLLITGGSGFIGRHVIEIARQREYEILNIDLVRPSFDNSGFQTLVSDVRDEDTMSRVFSDFAPTHVLHLAAETDISIGAVEDFTTIIKGSDVLFRVSAAQRAQPRFVHVSTQYVLRPGVAPRDELHRVPYTAYGEAKAISEERLWESQLSNWSIVRPCIVWGPHFTTFADGLLKYIGAGQYLHPATRKPIMRTFGYVENVADQMLGILDIPASDLSRKVFFLGDAVMDYAQWADAFSNALTGRPARRVPKSFLYALGVLGEGVKKTGLPFPYNLGRYERMTIASPYDLRPTFEAVGEPPVDFDSGVEKTASWLNEYWSRKEQS